MAITGIVLGLAAIVIGVVVVVIFIGAVFWGFANCNGQCFGG
jgi:hypothetical protein